MTRRLSLPRVLLAAAGALTLACGGEKSPTAPQIASVTLSTTAATLVPTATVQLNATAKDVGGNTLSSNVTWTSSDQSRATVSASGLVTGVAVGTATITASAGSQSASALVTVKEGAIVGVNGGTVTALGGTVTLTVPQGAVTSNVQVTVQAATNPTASPRLIAGTAIELGPSGQQWTTPIRLSIRYTPTQLPTGASEQLLRINRDAGGSWQPVAGSAVDVGAKVVSANLTSFSTYSVLSSPITSVSIAPDKATLEEGATQQLVATAHDDANVTITDVVIDWQSSNTAVATVSSDGVITAVAPGGPIDITATANGHSATTSITVIARPAIGLPAATFNFSALAGGADPPPQVVAVSNTGGGTLDGLTATPSATWLTATLAATVGPTTLTLRATTGVMAPGTYSATVVISSSHSGVASRTIQVIFTISQPGIRLSASSLSFSGAAGAPDPNAQQVDVTSATSATIGGLSVSVFCPVQGPCGWLRAVLAGTSTPTKLTVQALTGSLPAGTYTTTVTVSSSQQGVASATLTVTFVVGSGQSIALSSTTASFTGSTGGANPSAQSIDVTNGGTGTLTGLATAVTYPAGEATGWLFATLNQSTAPAKLTITPNIAGLATGIHPATVTVSSSITGVASRTVAVTLTLLAPSIVVNAGSNQAAMAGTAVPTPPSVLVRDGLGLPMPGLTVTFSITGGSGVLTSPVTTTNASGVATVGSWVLGSVANPNAASASVVGPGFGAGNNSVAFSATGCEGGGSGYAITLCFVTPMTASQRAAFEDASGRWSSLITGDLSDINLSIGQGTCGPNSPSMNMTIDDVAIFARVEPIDGVNGALSAAGPCFIRTSNHLTVLGQMLFDSADLPSLEANNQLGSVILHEMGHVLGIGSLWTTFGLLKNPSTVGGPALDTYFAGTNAIAGFDAIGGSTYTGGQKVPVENMFSAGTINSHWRESVLANELMTGFLNSGSNPLSVVTVRSLQDLGYTVNAGGADPFHLSLSLRAMGESAQRPYGNDVIVSPLHTVDQRGRIVRIR